MGQRAGCEAAIHAMRLNFADEDTKGVMLVDAFNAFNSLNHHVILLNMFQLCPPLANILTNTYRSAYSLFIAGISLLSQEDTTQIYFSSGAGGLSCCTLAAILVIM